jgi:dTDP-4-dehydrorhamnose 3,5-epimerase
MQFEYYDIGGVAKITPTRHQDERGYFSEVFRDDLFRKRVADVTLVQYNQSLSRPKGTVRGLHFQLPPAAQGKLVRCLKGAIFDVAVDLRRSSATYGRHVTVELSADRGDQLWVPEGFAHGFCTLEPDTEVLYGVTSFYSAEHDRGVLWSDPDIGIRWPVDEKDAVLSAKDARQPRLCELGDHFQ